MKQIGDPLVLTFARRMLETFIHHASDGGRGKNVVLERPPQLIAIRDVSFISLQLRSLRQGLSGRDVALQDVENVRDFDLNDLVLVRLEISSKCLESGLDVGADRRHKSEKELWILYFYRRIMQGW